ncbi:MAG: MFS transporter, partial [Actinomycetota bacterium]
RLPAPATDRPAPSGRNPLGDIVEGVRYVYQRRPLRRLVLSSFFVIMFGFNYVAFYPAMIEGVFGLDDTYVGYISSASALGAVAISIPLAGRADSPWARAAMVIGGLGFGFGVILFGLSPSFWVAFAVIIGVGVATTIYQSLSNTLALGMADDEHQGRVQSLMQLSFAGFGIAAAPLGFLAELIGLRTVVVLMGTVAAISVMLYTLFEGGPKALRPDQPVRSHPEDPRPDGAATATPGSNGSTGRNGSNGVNGVNGGVAGSPATDPPAQPIQSRP